MRRAAKYVAVGLLFVCGAAAAAPPDNVLWQSWSTDTFEQAQEQNKPIYLYLEAVWCHWCHVFQHETLNKPAIAAQLNKDFIPVRVDHDAQPALADRYRAWGWPAQIWFAPDGSESAKRSGHIGPERFTALLDEIAANPKAEHKDKSDDNAVADSPYLNKDVRERIVEMHKSAYDSKEGGLRLNKKFLDAGSVEYAMWRGRHNDPAGDRRARKTLDAAIQLIDPVWGGVYQYSVHGNWNEPHYEKLMRSQARYLRIYSLAYLQYDDPNYRKALFAVRDYLANFLQSPEGGFYTSQDADLIPGQKAHGYFKLDDKKRRARGLPKVDRHRYTDANGSAIEGLAEVYAATGDKKSLNMATRAANWIEQNRALADGGYRHGATDDHVYMSDNLAMGRAYLALHRATGQRKYLKLAQAAADFMATKFKRETAGFDSALQSAGPLMPQPDLDTNTEAVRFYNLLSHYTGNKTYRQLAEHGMRYLAVPARATGRIDESAILLADIELSQNPVHLTIVGAKDAKVSAQLYRAALGVPGWYRRVEWWDRSQGPLAHADVNYPDLGQPAAFFCEDKRCSLPQFSGEDLRKLVKSRQAES